MYAKFARYYDRLTGNVDYQARTEYFCEVIRRHYAGHGHLLLDLACGTGTLSFLLADQGWEVIGVDGSEEMLACAMCKLDGYEGRRPFFLCQDMERLDLFGTVNVCVCALDSINHLPGLPALKKVFGRLSLFIETDGLLIFDVNTPYKHERILKNQSFVYETEEVFCVWQNTLEQDGSNKVTIDLDFFEKAERDTYRRSSESFSEYVFTTEELAEAGGQAGFELLAVYTADTFLPVQPDAQRMVFVMQNKTMHRTC